MKVWTAEMSDSNDVDKMKKALEEICKSVDDAMGELNMQGRALMSFRWIKKLAERGLGKDE